MNRFPSRMKREAVIWFILSAMMILRAAGLLKTAGVLTGAKPLPLRPILRVRVMAGISGFPM